MEKNKIEYRCEVSDLHVESRAEGAESRTISGYAAVFESWSEPIYGFFREKVARGAFDGADFSKCIMCFNHNEDNILARVSSKTLSYEVDNRGLHFSFEAPNTTVGNDMLEMVRRGDISQCSFRFVVAEEEWNYASDGTALDERTITKFSAIYDLSLVVYPAYEATEASARSLYEERRAAHVKPDNTEAAARAAKEAAETEARARQAQEVEVTLALMEL